jgi:sulfite reductase beta subunit-like hemoprotein
MNFIKRYAATAVMSLLDEKAEEDLESASTWPALAVIVLPLLAAAVPMVVDHVKRKNRKDARFERLEDLLGPQLEQLEKERQEMVEYDKARELLDEIETAKWVITKREKKEKEKKVA